MLKRHAHSFLVDLFGPKVATLAFTGVYAVRTVSFSICKGAGVHDPSYSSADPLPRFILAKLRTPFSIRHTRVSRSLTPLVDATTLTCPHGRDDEDSTGTLRSSHRPVRPWFDPQPPLALHFRL